MAATSHKRRWSSRIGTIIRRTSKTDRLRHSISFDHDVEFVPRSCDDGGHTLPHVALDILESRLSTLCTIAESPLREAAATQSAAGLCSGEPVYEVNTPSSGSSCRTSQAVTDSPDLVPLVPRNGENSIIPPSTHQYPIYFNESQAREPPQLGGFTDDPSLTTENGDPSQVPYGSEPTDDGSTTSFYEMARCNSIHYTPSNSSLSATSTYRAPLNLGHVDTDFLLLASHGTMASPATTHSFDDNVISWFPFSAPSDKLDKLHTMGWRRYHFPNGNSYHFHPERKISTEVDLTNDTFLDLVEQFWDEEGMNIDDCFGLRRHSSLGATVGGLIEGEVWLKDVGLSNEGSKLPVMFEMWWIDHAARTMVLASQGFNDGEVTIVQEDQLDMEHRYWAFMESHPAHNVLPPNAASTAINTLAWAWTDHLLTSRPSDSIPFTREECRELLTLLQSLSVEKRHHQVIQTCIVAMVFLQVVQWHKSHRPDKLTSPDMTIHCSESTNQLPVLEKSWVVRHIFLDLVIFILILFFTFLYAMYQGGLVFTRIQVFVDGQTASTLLPTLNWTRTLRFLGLLE